MSETDQIAKPYYLFVGDISDEVIAKTALGIVQWRPSDCLAQTDASGAIDLGLPRMSPQAAAASGARTLVIGIAPAGGALPPAWISAIVEALEAGLDIASGLHIRLDAIPEIAETAARHKRQLFNVRIPSRAFAVGKGLKRTGKRLLTVGTDCAVGKKYTALAIHRALENKGIPATFRATGQTGILISGAGVAIDAVVADFVSGAAEWLSPDAPADHWDIVEGQGSLAHPSYAAVSLGLLHGSQPDAFIVCHDPARTTMTSTSYPVPSISRIIDLTIGMGRLTNPAIACAGIALNTSKLDEATAHDIIGETQRALGLPCCDPIRFGVESIVEELL
ncbi:MAG TPA: DUF1611 domain-containing protein [Hyphomonadaceae bacterium]|nr:DUF1611 domain-containing protein [Hyphomonadaceae bacterium]HPN04188.1 DUF1611 domain-containing protein [Hyphomonadaceae bacterium]